MVWALKPVVQVLENGALDKRGESRCHASTLTLWSFSEKLPWRTSASAFYSMLSGDTPRHRFIIIILVSVSLPAQCCRNHSAVAPGVNSTRAWFVYRGSLFACSSSLVLHSRSNFTSEIVFPLYHLIATGPSALGGLKPWGQGEEEDAGKRALFGCKSCMIYLTIQLLSSLLNFEEFTVCVCSEIWWFPISQCVSKWLTWLTNCNSLLSILKLVLMPVCHKIVIFNQLVTHNSGTQN